MRIHLFHPAIILPMLVCLAFFPMIQPVSADGGYADGGFMIMPQWLYDRIENSFMSSVIGGPHEDEEIPTFETWMEDGEAALLGGAYRDALSAFNQALTLDLSSPDAWYGKGAALEGIGRYQSAIEAYEKARSLAGTTFPVWKIYGGLGRSYLFLNSYDTAISMLTRAIDAYDSSGTDDEEARSDLVDALEQAEQALVNVPVER